MILAVVQMHDVEAVGAESLETFRDRRARRRRAVVPHVELAPPRRALGHGRLAVRPRDADFRAQDVAVARQRCKRAAEAFLREAAAVQRCDVEKADAARDRRVDDALGVGIGKLG